MHYTVIVEEEDLRKEIQKVLTNALFVFDSDYYTIQMMSDYFDLFECSYFIFAKLSIPVMVNQFKVSYGTPLRLTISNESHGKKHI